MHQLSPYLRGRSADGYAEALQELESIEPDKYDFAKALLLLEHHVRIPELMQRILVEESIRETSEKIDKMVQTVPNENREAARNCIREVAEPFLSYYRNNRNQFLENLQDARRGSTLVLDFHRIFVDKPEALNAFLSDALAVSFSRQELVKLSDLLKFFVSLTKLPFKEQSPSAPSPADSKPSVPELPAGLGALAQLMAASGISKESACKFLELMGLKVGGKPGRPVKDYSREYELKASGLSWTEVARKSLRENPEFCEEFGKRDFQSLTFEERENLKNRIREGVRNYAERAGKPFPIETVESVGDQDRPAEK